MAIVVEDGTIVTGANSYVTEAVLTAYATARGVTLNNTLTNEQLLIKAMDYIENLVFKGLKLSETQPLQWPRADVVIDGYAISIETIPQLLKDALCEVAIAIDDSEDPLANIERVAESETVGPISVTYKPGQDTTIVRRINNKLRKLLKGNGNNGISFIVDRG